MAKITEVRLTIAAFIYAIEIDLKRLIVNFVVPNYANLSFLRDEKLIEKIKERYSKENPGIDSIDLDEAVEFLDFQDSYTTIFKNKDLFPERIVEEMNRLSASLDNLVPVRNRVMHTRPLNVSDFPDVWAFVTEIYDSRIINWIAVKETREKLETDPSFVLTLSLPAFESHNVKSVHNLPIPDFDDTGFIGRKKDSDTIKNLILGNNRVVSIIGDGGVGKTALAVKVVYDILDLDTKNPFDFIVWMTAKSTLLTVKGIQEIRNTLRDYSGIFSGISDLIGLEKGDTVEEQISEYFDVFNTLIILDNLETILDEKVREFIRNAQMKCKILITSRIGLGELEFRYPLKGLSPAESVQLVRVFSNLKKTEVLNKFDNSKLQKIATDLHYNPLALKWFVNSVEHGISPDDVLRNTDDLLNFCLSNVFNKLSKNSKLILKTILAARSSLSDAQIVFLTDLTTLDYRKSLNELFATTFIAREIINLEGSQEVLYLIPEFAKEYLLKNFPVDIEFVKNITKRTKSLTASVNQIQKLSDMNEFKLTSLEIRNTNEKVVARLISEALHYSKNSEFEKSLEKLSEARAILPNYFEIYRVSAFIKVSKQDILSAEEDYKMALEFEPENPRLLYFYAQFLLFHLDDVTTALQLAVRLNTLRPQSAYPTLLLARCYSTTGDHEQANGLLLQLIKTVTLSQSLKRVVYTDLISHHGHWGIDIIQKDGDYSLAKEKFKEAFNIFEACVREKIHDQRMVRNFCNSIKAFIKFIPTIHGESDIPRIRELLRKYDDLISINQSKTYLQTLVQEKYPLKAPQLKGQVASLISGRNFGFIQAENGQEYFMSKSALIDGSLFDDLSIGTIVHFNLGQNSTGVCAINVTLAN